MRNAWAVVALLALAPMPAAAQAWDAQTDRSTEAAGALEARTNAELAEAPVPRAPDAMAFELEVLWAQYDAIDLTGINAMQYIGVAAIAVGGAACIVGVFLWALLSVTGHENAYESLAGFDGGGGGAILLGVTLLAVAETSDDLHRRRALRSRIRALGGVALAPGGLTVRF